MAKSIFFSILLAFLLTACYSFTGGSVPAHLKTLQIMYIEDNSGQGNPLYREELNLKVAQRFRDDNSFQLVDTRGDATLKVVITGITDAPVALQAGEIERERKVNVSCKVEYYDAVNRKQIWGKNFSNFQFYELANAQANRDEAVILAMEQIAEELLLAVVSGW